MKANDNDTNDRRIETLEASLAKMREDLERVVKLLKVVPDKELKTQKGAIEKSIYRAQSEIGKIRGAKGNPSRR